MALLKEIKTVYGVSASYWRIVETNINWLSRCAHVTIAGYVDGEARNTGNQPLMLMHFDFFDYNFPFTKEEAVRREAYEAIKTMPEFAGAEDC